MMESAWPAAIWGQVYVGLSGAQFRRGSLPLSRSQTIRASGHRSPKWAYWWSIASFLPISDSRCRTASSSWLPVTTGSLARGFARAPNSTAGVLRKGDGLGDGVTAAGVGSVCLWRGGTPVEARPGDAEAISRTASTPAATRTGLFLER